MSKRGVGNSSLWYVGFKLHTTIDIHPSSLRQNGLTDLGCAFVCWRCLFFSYIQSGQGVVKMRHVSEEVMLVLVTREKYLCVAILVRAVLMLIIPTFHWPNNMPQSHVLDTVDDNNH